MYLYMYRNIESALIHILETGFWVLKQTVGHARSIGACAVNIFSYRNIEYKININEHIEILARPCYF